MIAYIGAGFLAFGLFVVALAVSSSFALTAFIVLGAFVAAMGAVLVALGLQKPPKQAAAEKIDDDGDWEFEIL